jgi:hypothetical protein
VKVSKATLKVSWEGTWFEDALDCWLFVPGSEGMGRRTTGKVDSAKTLTLCPWSG